MPLIKSAIKRARQNEVRHARLLPFKTRMKTAIRKFTVLVKAGNAADAAALLPEVYKTIDTAAKKNIIHRNNAARKKANASKMVAAISA